MKAAIVSLKSLAWRTTRSFVSSMTTTSVALQTSHTYILGNSSLTDADNLVRFNHVRVQISDAFGKSDLILNGRVACGYPSKEFESNVLTYLTVRGYYTALDVKFASHWIYFLVCNREKEAHRENCFRSLLNTILNASIFVTLHAYDFQRYLDETNQSRLHRVFRHYFWEHYRRKENPLWLLYDCRRLNEYRKE